MHNYLKGRDLNAESILKQARHPGYSESKMFVRGHGPGEAKETPCFQDRPSSRLYNTNDIDKFVIMSREFEKIGSFYGTVNRVAELME